MKPDTFAANHVYLSIGPGIPPKGLPGLFPILDEVTLQEKHCLESNGYIIEWVYQTKAEKLVENFPFVIKYKGILYGFAEQRYFNTVVNGGSRYPDDLQSFCDRCIRLEDDEVLK